MAEINRINSFKSFTEVKSVEKTNKLREENQAKRKQLSQKFESLLDELGITSYEGLDEETKKSLVSKLLGEEKNGTNKEAGVKERNAFIYAAAKAKQEGKDSFDFHGKTYKITLKADTGLKESVVNEAKSWELGKDYPTYGVVVGIRKNGDLCEVSFDSGNKIVFRDNGGEWVQESVVNEAKGFKNTKDFFSFLEEIDGMPESAIKKIMGKDYIDTPGGYRDEAEDYDNDIEEYMISNMGRKDYEKLAAWWENNVAESVVTESHFKVGDKVKMSHGGTGVIVSLDKEDGADDEKYYNVELPSGEIHKHSPNELTKESVVNEEDITTDDQFKEYAMTVLKKAFGEDFDDAKAGEVVNGILKQADGDYGAAVGILTSSLGESSITEAFDANYWEDYHKDGSKMKNPTGMQIMQEVSGCVEDWNDNNEDGEDNEVTPAGEKKVLKLAKKFVKAKGYISSDIIDAMIAQES